MALITEEEAKEILKRPYARVFIPEEDGSFSTYILEFPGCISWEATLEKAYAKLEAVAESWLMGVDKSMLPEPKIWERSGKW